jgi:type IV secretory pathway VirB10-like protein
VYNYLFINKIFSMKKNILLMMMLLIVAFTSFAQEPNEKRPPKPPTIEEHLSRVSQELNKQTKLTAEQKEKILAAYKTFFTQIESYRKKENQPPPPPPPPVSKEVADKLTGERDAKIKEFLSADDFKKYLEIEKSLRPKHPREKAEN